MVANKATNVNAIAEQFDVSRQAISLHIKILMECGLITVQQQGRERICEAQLESLNEVSVWVEQYKQFWERKLDSLEMYLQELQGKSKKSKKSKKH